VQGVGGMGKSALAFEYAHSYAAEYPGGRYLIRGSGVADFHSQIIALAEYKGVYLIDSDHKNPEQAFQRVRAAFQRGPCSLLLIDDFDNPDLLTPEKRFQCLPSGAQVHILFTTRLEPTRFIGIEFVLLDELTVEEGKQLLRLHRPFITEEESHAAEEIVKRLQGYPIALEVVAVYLWRNPTVTYSAYLAFLDKEGFNALEQTATEESVTLSRHREKALSVVLRPTLDSLRPEELLAMHYAALLPSSQVPLPWLRELVGEHFPLISVDPEPGWIGDWMRLKKRLLGLRLIAEAGIGNVTRMHRLIQQTVVACMSTDARERRWSELVSYSHTRADEIAKPVSDDLSTCLPEHDAFADYVRNVWTEPSKRWELDPLHAFSEVLMTSGEPETGLFILEIVAFAFKSLGRFGESISIYQYLLRYYEPSRYDTYSRSSYLTLSLAELYLEQGSLQDALSLCQSAVDLRTEVFGRANRLTASALDRLGDCHLSLNDFLAAWKCYLEAFETKGMCAEKHPSLAVTLIKVGFFCQFLGLSNEAEAAYLRAILTLNDFVGVRHPDFALFLLPIGDLYRVTGRSALASRCFRHALSIWEAVAWGGKTHPSAAPCLQRLASINKSEGLWAEAEQCYRRSLGIHREFYGSGRYAAAIDMDNLATCLSERGQFDEAEQLYQEAHEIFVRTFGPDHQHALVCVFHQGCVAMSKKDYDRAEKLLVGCLAVLEGRQDTETELLMDVMRRLVVLYSVTKKRRKSFAIFIRLARVVARHSYGRGRQRSVLSSGWIPRISVNTVRELRSTFEMLLSREKL